MAYRKLLILAFFISISSLVSCRHENPDKRTDAMVKLAFRYLGERKYDSLYRLTDPAFKIAMPYNMFADYSKKLARLSPFTIVNFMVGNDSVSFYKIEGQKQLNCYISLDKQGKIKAFFVGPLEDDIKPNSMNAYERATDVFARKVLNMMRRRQADSMYLFAGDGLKRNVDAKQWRTNTENILDYSPMPPAVFLRSENDVNVYAMGPLRFRFGSIDKAGKFNTFYFVMYQPQQTKSLNIATDNSMKTKVDSVADKVISPYIETLDNAGISAAVLYKGKTYYYNYGEKKLGQHTLPDKHTLYDIGSITKTFTGTLLAMAVNQHKVTLETSITKYLPDSVAANPDLKNITFKQLANHTAGLPREGGNYQQFITNVDQPYEHYDDAAMFSFLKHFKQTRQPAARYAYSNLGFGLLGVLLERIYQQPYTDLVRQYITGPLKMNETVFAVDTLKDKDWAQGYDGLLNPVPYFKLLSVRSAGEIKSSSYDLLTYAKAQLSTPDTTPSAAFDLSHQITFQGANPTALGWEYWAGSNSVVGHGGATGGYRAAIWTDLTKQIAVVTLTNNASNGHEVGAYLMKALQDVK